MFFNRIFPNIFHIYSFLILYIIFIYFQYFNLGDLYCDILYLSFNIISFPWLSIFRKDSIPQLRLIIESPYPLWPLLIHVLNTSWYPETVPTYLCSSWMTCSTSLRMIWKRSSSIWVTLSTSLLLFRTALTS